MIRVASMSLQRRSDGLAVLELTGGKLEGLDWGGDAGHG